ncbi:MAG TPA: phospholipase D-like domain-containing protein [Bryobacteraceae bacterium]|nr:phospholipase D-like domain-containing protein [Bryobacteraceae bacterium]
MKLYVQPGDGVMPLVQAINKAKKSVEIVIFRFDRGEVEKALAAAVSRGVFVHALIAYTNRGGERNLRKLEMQLLAAGVTVARSADDLARYHGKFMIIDREDLYVLAFNFTYLDIEHSRSFGVVTSNPKLVQEAVKLFEADIKRQPYVADVPNFVVSPVNARKELSAFLKDAKKSLLIYDPEVSDTEMIRVLEERAKAGVEVKILGRLSRKSSKLDWHKLGSMRLHTRTIIRDGSHAFIGSQSLRDLELSARREVGLIFRDVQIVSKMSKIFAEDWTATGPAKEPAPALEAEPAAKVAKKVAKAVAKELPPVAPVVEVLVKEVVGEQVDVDVDRAELEESVKDAVKEAVREAVRDVVEEVVAQNGNESAKVAEPK